MTLPNYKAFEAATGQAVELEADGIRLQAHIAEVEAMRNHVQEAGHGDGNTNRQPFSVLFISEDEEPMAQQVFTLHHEQLGPAELFLVPVGPQNDGMAYEAIFT